ncbi:MAG: hypothetical protein HY591_01570, partial [Candidatus Omnitrophica bacterium]|nr:hypothetical protein [Candidatus Omnitrophota bacterium]
QYTGCDISKTGIERARQKYPGAQFILTEPGLENIQHIRPDFILSRDVILHQTDPFEFLKKVCSIARNGVFLRLRTRDVGSTVLDVEQSCQLNYGLWAPYIIMNCDELVTFLCGLKLCSKIWLLKNYMVLGGYHGRYLPKDCYLEETGTAESGMFIEIEHGCSKPEVKIEERKEGFSVPLYARLVKRLIQYTKGLGSQRVWW